jgi:16S rRNA processing protein RimM
MGEKILIGKIVNVFGVTGEVKVYSYSGESDRFETLETVTVDGRQLEIQAVKYSRNMPVLKLEGVNSRDDAERLRGKEVFMDEEDLEELPEGEYYIRDLIGMEVIREESGERLGILRDVLTDRPQDLYVVETGKGRRIMIPGVDEFIRTIDMERGTIGVVLIEGMEENAF